MYLFTNFVLFVLIWWVIFFISLPMKISIPTNTEEGYATSAPKKTYIRLKVIITTATTLIIMLILMLLKFDLGDIFK